MLTQASLNNTLPAECDRDVSTLITRSSLSNGGTRQLRQLQPWAYPRFRVKNSNQEAKQELTYTSYYCTSLTVFFFVSNGPRCGWQCAGGCHLPKTRSKCLPDHLTSPVPHLKFRMSHTPSHSSNFRAIFVAALKEYEKKTKKDLLTHPLIAQLQVCNSLADILAVLRARVQQFERSASGDDTSRRANRQAQAI